ncbi:hypothetical protein [Arthrobacter oryzae]|uniref:Uncharacterized protein n=1 Tax=Arthrobacter oryzae TaxID=409290 RepID=A0A3N0C3R6_9MICC|nr:hypothetical protein [Arthrobacter oryzae]RNL57261.1 hypothetical protein D7003_07345 [Arthrobacter oryzae]
MRKIASLCASALFATSMIVPAGHAAAAPAEVSHNQAVGGFFNTCNDEFITFTGTARTIDKPNADGSVKTSFNIHGKGTGSLGNEYVVHYNLLLVRASTGHLTLDDEKAILVSKGSAPNQSVLFHFSSDSPEIIFEIVCRG